MPLPYAALVGTGALLGLGYFVASHWEEVQYHWNGIMAHIEAERRKSKLPSSYHGDVFFDNEDDESTTETEELASGRNVHSRSNELRLRELTMPRNIDSLYSSQFTLSTAEDTSDELQVSDVPSSFAVISSDSEWTDGIA